MLKGLVLKARNMPAITSYFLRLLADLHHFILQRGSIAVENPNDAGKSLATSLKGMER